MKITSELYKEIKRELKSQSRKEIQYDYGICKTTIHYITNSPNYKAYKHFIDLSRLVPSKRK